MINPRAFAEGADFAPQQHAILGIEASGGYTLPS